MMAELRNFNPGDGFFILHEVISLRAIWQRIILLQISPLILCHFGKAGFNLVRMTVEPRGLRFRVQSNPTRPISTHPLSRLTLRAVISLFMASTLIIIYPANLRL